MTPVEVEYEAFRSLRRRAVTLLCFALASSLAMGITVYVDSYSVREWNRVTDIGPIAMTVYVPYEGVSVDTFAAIAAIQRIAVHYSWYASLVVSGGEYWSYGLITVIDDDLLSEFPDAIDVIEGRLPTNTTETAVNAQTVYAESSIVPVRR